MNQSINPRVTEVKPGKHRLHTSNTSQLTIIDHKTEQKSVEQKTINFVAYYKAIDEVSHCILIFIIFILLIITMTSIVLCVFVCSVFRSPHGLKVKEWVSGFGWNEVRNRLLYFVSLWCDDCHRVMTQNCRDVVSFYLFILFLLHAVKLESVTFSSLSTSYAKTSLFITLWTCIVCLCWHFQETQFSNPARRQQPKTFRTKKETTEQRHNLYFPLFLACNHILLCITMFHRCLFTQNPTTNN